MYYVDNVGVAYRFELVQTKEQKNFICLSSQAKHLRRQKDASQI